MLDWEIDFEPVDLDSLPRREREKLRRRQEMLDTALRLFSEKGFHNVSMHEVARESEFAIATLYKFFKNKDDLYRALMIDMSDQVSLEIKNSLRNATNEVEVIREAILAKSRVFAEHLPVIRLYVAETRGSCYQVQEGLDEEMRKRREFFVNKLIATFESGIEKGMFADKDPVYLANAIISLSHSALMMSLEDLEKYPVIESTEKMLDIFFSEILKK